jgi:hypothetical protein
MKIEGPGGPNKAGAAKKSSSIGGVDAAYFRGLLATDEAEAAPPTSPTQQIAHIDSLLALQGAEDPTERAAQGKAKARAQGLLTELEKIRTGMLLGNLTVGHMVDMADVVASHRDRIHDPKLTELLDEIDLRAQVEIAKLRVALDRQSGI